ncbi:unnamed protein product [Sphagnum jensenii]|uniref:40S ribosomal protein S4 n=1 Tax=Sphagnum jensenii TaxID=128206 RepID=A0ABP1A6E9_9BRYO
MLRNRLKYALTYRKVVAIVMQRLIAIDGKLCTDKCYPAGFMGSISSAKFAVPNLINIETAEVVEFIKFDIVMVTGGHNRGRMGVIQHRK